MSQRFTLGIDLGQASSHTAVVLLAHDTVADPTFEVVHAERFPLGARYPELVERIIRPLCRPPLLGATIVAVDATGVGAPVLDLLEPRLPAGTRCYPIVITAGNNESSANGKLTVPKTDIVATTQILFQNHRIRIPATLPAKDELVEELLAYTVTIGASGHHSYRPAHSSGHDDLILALGLAAWTAKHKRGNTFKSYVPRGQIPTLSDDTRRAMGG